MEQGTATHSAALGVRVTGLNSLVRNLHKMGVSLEDLREAFGKLAADAADLAADLAPRRTGRLAASIRGSRARNYAAVTAGSKRVSYAGVINYGWPKRNIEASRFMQRADMLMRPRATAEIQAAINRLIRQGDLRSG